MGRIPKETLELLHDLFLLEEAGWNMQDELYDIGRTLGADEIPKYLDDKITFKEFLMFRSIARANNIPDEIFKQRLRHRKPIWAAATQIHKKRGGRNKRPNRISKM